MDKLREIQKNFIKVTYEVSIEHSKKSIAELEEEQEWEQANYAKEVLQGLEDELEWLLANEEELNKYFEEWHWSEQMMKRKKTKYNR